MTNVFTLDPQDGGQVATPPPANFTLPEGLVKFQVSELEPGSDQVVSIHTASTANVTGYAKYNQSTGVWSKLADDRVSIVSGTQVDVRLTDGGEGDADGVANGVIDDPGALLIETPDTTPPTVTGALASTPNVDGWFNGDVTVTWRATDAEFSSSPVAAPPSTIVNGEGQNLTATSVEACDVAGNCATGTLGGIHIDRSAPTVTIDGVLPGGEYEPGRVPEVRCTAADALSGLAADCALSVAGSLNDEGNVVFTATADDKAGNRGSTTTSVILRSPGTYEFGGFTSPVSTTGGNDKSQKTFKAGSTIPVKFTLTGTSPKRSPLWLQPTSGTVSGAPTATTYSFVDGQWQYNWKTKGLAAGTYTIGVSLDNGKTVTTTVTLK